MSNSEVYLLYDTNARDIQLYYGSNNKDDISNNLEYEEKDEFTILYSPEDNRNYTDIKVISRTKLKNRPQSAGSFDKKLKHTVEGVIVRRTNSFSSIEELYLLKKQPLIRPLLSETEILTLQKLQEECKNQRYASFRKETEFKQIGKAGEKRNLSSTDFSLPNIQALDALKLKDLKIPRSANLYDKEAFPFRKTTEEKQQKEKLAIQSPKLREKSEGKIFGSKQQKKSKEVKEAKSGLKKGDLKAKNLATSNKIKAGKENKSELDSVHKQDDKVSKKGRKRKSEQPYSKSEGSVEGSKTKDRKDKTDKEKSEKKHEDTTTKKIYTEDNKTQSGSDLKKNHSKATAESLRKEKKAHRIGDSNDSRSINDLKNTISKSTAESLNQKKKAQRGKGHKSGGSDEKSLHSSEKSVDKKEQIDNADSSTKKRRSKQPASSLDQSRTNKRSSTLGLISQEGNLKPPAEKSETLQKNKNNKDKDKKLKNVFQYIIQYVLSDPKFFKLGWTIKPTDKSNSRLVTFKTLPANSQTYVFRDRGHTETKQYGSGKSAIAIELDGTGNIYYPEGSSAIVITKHEKCKRLVVYSNPKKDPLIKESFNATTLGIFDSFGNGEVYDTKGNKVLCYDQLEGFYKNSTKNITFKWKWNSYETLKQRQIKEILNSMVEDVKKSASQKNRKETKSPNLQKKTTVEKKSSVDRIYESVLAELPQPTAPKSPLNNDQLPTNFKPIILKINQEITLRINGQDKLFLTFKSEKCFYKIDIGVVIDPAVVESIDELKGDQQHSLPCKFASLLHLSPSLQNLCLPK